MSQDWFVLIHDSKCCKSLISFIESLNVEAYSPVRMTLYPRKNRPSPQSYEVVLFPGYMFLRFDYTAVHFTQITALNGAYGFVRFGDSAPHSVPDAEIAQLKLEIERYRTELLQKAPAVIDMSPADRTPNHRTISFVVRENSSAARVAGWCAFMKESDAASRAAAKRLKLKLSF